MSVKLTWYGHATLGLEVNGQNVLVDPFLAGNPAASTGPESLEPEWILISHGHDDHVADAIEIAKRSGAKVISNDEIANWFERNGVEAHHQHIGGGFNYPFGYLTLTQALHGSCLPDGTYGGNPAGFLLTTKDGKKIYMACDTGLFGDMRLIGDEGIDLAVLPIGDNYTMGPDDALRAVEFLRPKHVVPVHYSTFELIEQDPNAWAERVRSATDSEVHVLKPGESLTLD